MEALISTLLEAESIAYSASVSGTYLSTEMFPRLGIADQIKEKSKRIQSERVGVGAKDTDAARALIQFLSSPAAVPAITKNGLEPVTSQ